MINRLGYLPENIKAIISECFDMKPNNKGFTWRNNIKSMADIKRLWTKGDIWLGMNEDNKPEKRQKFGRQEVSKKEIEENSKKAMEILRKKREARNGK
jgi:hypothetical protein